MQYPQPTSLTQQQQYFGSSIFVRRPSPLLKSPSVDSESCDPPNPTISVTSYENEYCTVNRVSTSVAQRQGVNSQPGTSNILDRSTKHCNFGSAFRYRTDSETTDDQCIPESLSEEPGHDSAFDTTEDVDEEDVEEEEGLYDVSPNIDGPKVPQLRLSEVDKSSTESEKTIIMEGQLSISIQDVRNSVDNNAPILSFMTDNLISSDNSHQQDCLRKPSKLSLPEIVILPGTPSASSPSAPSSPNSLNTLSSSSVSIITAAQLASQSTSSNAPVSVQSLVNVSESSVPVSSTGTINVKCNNQCQTFPISKPHSIPPHVLSMVPSSSLDYEQLLTYNNTSSTNNTTTTTTSAAASCCSSRSESPLSDRGVIKCSSLISLHLRNIDADRSATGFPVPPLNFNSETALDADSSNTQVKTYKFLVA